MEVVDDVVDEMACQGHGAGPGPLSRPRCARPVRSSESPQPGGDRAAGVLDVDGYLERVVHLTGLAAPIAEAAEHWRILVRHPHQPRGDSFDQVADMDRMVEHRPGQRAGRAGDSGTHENRRPPGQQREDGGPQLTRRCE